MDQTASTSDLLDIDTSFLDAYRHGGSEKPSHGQARKAKQHQQTASVQGADSQSATGTNEGEPRLEVEPSPPDHDDVGNRDEPNHDRQSSTSTRSQTGHAGGTVQRGGAGAPGGVSGTGPAGGAIIAPRAQPEEEGRDDAANTALSDERTLAPKSPHSESVAATPESLQLTDHQEAVQAATSSARGGASDSSSAGNDAVLPSSGFRIGGVKSQPHIKTLPESIMGMLREQLRSAAVRELDVSDRAARAFSQRLSQGTLVTAFLLAHLDLRIDVDAATMRATELFRSFDPLLGSVATRMEDLERLEHDHGELLRRLHQDIEEVRQTSAVIEQAVAYSIADRTENFLRGSHNIHDAPLGHKDAVFVRDRAREATRKQQKIERDRNGRPIR